MHTIEPISLTALRSTDYASLIKIRIRKILMICSHYDAFILEEDGQIETQIYHEYIELNLSNSPHFIWATSSAQAHKIIDENSDIDMVMAMYNANDNDIFAFSAHLKQSHPNVPFVLLTHISNEITKRLNASDTSNVDYVFSWHGNAELIVAIIKLFEDRANAENDILNLGVQAILLVEDSIRYYSTYLPELYKLILSQSREFLKDIFNEQERKNRKRSRPKILLATNYEDALNMYEKYKTNLLGVISDVGFVLHRGDDPSTEKLDAGIDLVKTIKADDPNMPVLLQSSQESISKVAAELGVGFLRKYSKSLMLELHEYIREEFGFGDFIVLDKDNQEHGRATNLRELEAIVKDLPDEVLLYNISRNRLSKWFFSRGLFSLAHQFRKVNLRNFADIDAVRRFVVQQIHDYHALSGRGVIAHFEQDSYDRYIWFARLGEGSLGGKARGLGFLNSLIQKHNLSNKYENFKLSIPRTVVVATDYFTQFIQENDLQFVIESNLSDEEILSEFVASRLPERLVEQLRTYINTVRTPLAVRSSSNLEDSNYQPFAGVYSTYMIPITDNKTQMLRLLGKAIKSVYASVFYKGSKAYIQSTGNLLNEEMMAVVIQSICGTQHDGFYYPMLSGVARSVNFYPIGAEKPEDGIVQVAFGLGKTVVDGGEALRFSPKFPKKILQLSDPKIAQRDTQKTMYALDLNPEAFTISKDDSINLAHFSVVDGLRGFNYPELVASTYSIANQRLVPGVDVAGPRVISFDAILKYGRFPLHKVLEDVMAICREELMCDVEIEFAMDIVPDSGGRQAVLKLLQVRPISRLYVDPTQTLDSALKEISQTIVSADKALGTGRIRGMRNIIYVRPETFDSAHTREIAAEIAQINSEFAARDEGYLIIGPGRWGSSDPWLGIPVCWADISQAKMIVECAIPGYRIEPSQGTHFFQNITSLGIGYLTIDTVANPQALSSEFFSSLSAGAHWLSAAATVDIQEIHHSEFISVYKLPTELIAHIDRDKGIAVVGI